MRNSLSACAFREVFLWIVLQCYWELPLVRSRRGDPLPVGGTGRMRLSTVTTPARSPSRITATEIAHTIAKGMGDERGPQWTEWRQYLHQGSACRVLASDF